MTPRPEIALNASIIIIQVLIIEREGDSATRSSANPNKSGERPSMLILLR